jgi:hypothetical protein
MMIVLHGETTGGAGGAGKGALPAGRALTKAENNLAKKHAPTDKDCKVTCPFSHSPIQGQLIVLPEI